MKKKYDQYFPNTKKKQIERLNHQLDSVQLIEDTLTIHLKSANDLISKQVNELNELHSKINTLKSHSENTLSDLQNEVEKLKDSVHYLSYFHIVCLEEMIPQNAGEEPRLENTCNWRNYKLVEIGSSDYKGRYTWTTDIFKKEGDSLTKISIVELFKPQLIVELEALINARLKEDFAYLMETNRACFPRHMAFPGYKLSDMRLIITDNSEMSFEINYGLSNACYAVNAASALFKIKEMIPYLIE